MTEMLSHFQDQLPAMIDLLTQMVEIESFTQAKANVDQFGEFIEQQFNELGASSVTRYPQEKVGDFLLGKWNESKPGKPILFIVHLDTVWPIGTVAERPPRIEDGIYYAPGAVDMKGGITLMLSAIRGLRELDQMPDRPIWALVTSDEEIGSTYSEHLIHDIAKGVGLVLIMEPGTPDGALKIWRKGVANYHLEIIGRPSHAGNAPEQGINSIVEFAQQTMRLQAMNDYKNGVSVSVTMANGGSAGNVIPERTTAYVDTRMMTMNDMNKLHENLTSLKPFIAGAKVNMQVLHQRPPMEYNDLAQTAFSQAKAIGERYGVTVRGDGSGGGSDGNLTAAIGIPTLDGMGPQGDGLHALHEQVVISSMPTRATLIAGILRDWQMES